MNAGGLTLDQQQTLAEKCEISLSWLEWNDPKADRNTRREARRDTYEAFKEKYLEHHSKEEPKSTPPPECRCCLRKICGRRHSARKPNLLRSRCALANPSLSRAKRCWDRLELPQGFHRRSNTGVRQGILTFRLGYAHTTDAKDRTGCPGGIDFNGAKFTPLSVDKKEPSWLVTARAQARSALSGMAQDFIRIMNLTPGASVSADFTAWVRDIATAFALPDGGNQSAAKQKIKKRLRQLNFRVARKASRSWQWLRLNLPRGTNEMSALSQLELEGRERQSMKRRNG